MGSPEKRPIDFYDFKGDIESLFALSGAASEFDTQATTAPWLHPGRSAGIARAGSLVGMLGALHPRLLKMLDIEVDIYAFEFDLAPLLARSVPRSTPVGRFPSVRRDLSFELPESVSYITVKAAVRAAVGSFLREIFVFDRYSGPNLGTGVKVSPSA